MAYSEQYRRMLHRLGYYDYQHGLIYRHMNQGEGWNTHLSNCRNFILAAVKQIKPSVITVLGSGWLLDLPLEEMLEHTESVRLIDIIHPPQAVSQVATLRKVELIEADVTGGLIEEVWKKAKRLPFYGKLKTLEGIAIPEFNLQGENGLVISLNILSQLETLPIKLLRKKSTVGEEEFIIFRRKIQEKHLQFLSRNRSILLTDICEVFIDRTGASSRIDTVIADLPEGKHSENWVWDFDLKGSDYFGKKSVMNVRAVML